MTTDLREAVRARYAEAAQGIAEGTGCGCDCDSIGCCGEEATTLFGQGLYGDDRSELPQAAVTASLGCGNPVAVAELDEGGAGLAPGSGGGTAGLSTGVVNPAPEKPAVLAEISRVLRPGGRIGISDVVAEERLSRAERADRGSFVGCIAGALSEGEYRAGLEEAGLTDVELQFTHRVADGMHAALGRARK